IGRDFAAAKSYSEHVAADIDLEVKAIMEKGYKDCEKILRDNRDKLDAVAAALLAHEKIDGEEFLKIVKGETAAEKAPEAPQPSEKA
ncbi:MAG: ATP-dependent zinc metalloprotease FtsH, partial [Oscillospiraceae bacterium]|nr:ATP-dependent zinc metalloprotease FtsH [Oscillospiraceae bacterium]